jgi:hypothetical protein
MLYYKQELKNKRNLDLFLLFDKARSWHFLPRVDPSKSQGIFPLGQGSSSGLHFWAWIQK